MSIPKYKAESGILYVRASLRPFANAIQRAGSVETFLSEHFQFQEIFSPYFKRARLFWENPLYQSTPTNSGALGKQLSKIPEAIFSKHPSHSFVGIGKNVKLALMAHDYKTSCFEPLSTLAKSNDFSMLLLGCCDSSPGFSTIHVTQHALGLSQKHLYRYLIRWDIENNGAWNAMIPSESPGCSASFDKFYSAYENDGNLERGKILGQDFLFVQSAARAIKIEKTILSETPRFVNCGKLFCSTCSLRTY